MGIYNSDQQQQNWTTGQAKLWPAMIILRNSTSDNCHEHPRLQPRSLMDTQTLHKIAELVGPES